MAYEGGTMQGLSRQGSQQSLGGYRGNQHASHHRLNPHGDVPQQLSRQPSQQSVNQMSRHESQRSINRQAYMTQYPEDQGHGHHASQPNLSYSGYKREDSYRSQQDLHSQQVATLQRYDSQRSISGQSRPQYRGDVQHYEGHQSYQGQSNHPEGHQQNLVRQDSQQSLQQRYSSEHPIHFDHHDNEAPPPYQRDPGNEQYQSDRYYNSRQPSQTSPPPHQNGLSKDEMSRSQLSLVNQSPYVLRREVASQHFTPKMSRRDQQPPRPVSMPSQSQLSRASSMSGGSHPIPDVGMEASQIVEILRKGIVYLTGGRDRQGGPVLTFPAHQARINFNSNDITVCLKYLSKIPSEESKRRGFTAIVDSRDGSWQNLVTVLGCLKQSLGDYIKQVLVVKADPTLDRGTSSSSFRRDRNNPNLEPQFVSVNRLHTYVDKNQLSGIFGGQLMYRHEEWLQNRLDLERFTREVRAASSHLDDSEAQIHQVYGNKGETTSPLESLRQHRFLQESIMNMPTQVIREGREILARLQRSSDVSHSSEEDNISTLDNLEDQKHVKRLIQYLENRVDKLQHVLEDRDRSLSLNLQYEDLQRSIKTVLTWILGPGEKLLASMTDIGDSYQTAEELRKRHEEMEIKCTDTYGQYAELRHKAEELINEEHTASEDIRSIRDYMDTVCRSFASRLERRRTLLITSVRFHRLAEEFSGKLEELLELLCTEIEAFDVSAAEDTLEKLSLKCQALDILAQQTIDDGQSLLDEMSRPVKNASGKDITPDYDSQIKHINGWLEDLQERKLRCDELADVRKLKLQQILQLRTCERDADQAINWILELCDVMAATHSSMGSTKEEAENLQADHKKFETTANGTYEYGKQLLQAALVLRRSLRYDLTPNNVMAQRLEEAWKQFSRGTNERANRLTVASMFLTSSEKILEKLDDIMVAISRTMSGELSVPEVLKKYGPQRSQVKDDYQETSHMGKTLIERLALPVIVLQGQEKVMSLKDQEATEIIGNRLNKLDIKMYDVDRYWSDMEQNKLPQKVQYDTRKRQTQPPSRAQTFSGPRKRVESQHSKPKQRRSTSDLEKQSFPIQKSRSGRVQGRPAPPERSGSLHRNKGQGEPYPSSNDQGPYRVEEQMTMSRTEPTQAVMSAPPMDERELRKRLEEGDGDGSGERPWGLEELSKEIW